MAHQKLTAEQARRVEEIDEFQRATDHLKRLVTELESNRAGQTRTIQQLSEKIANEASQMRQRALTARSEEHTSELQSRLHLVCRLLLEKKKAINAADEHDD